MLIHASRTLVWSPVLCLMVYFPLSYSATLPYCAHGLQPKPKVKSIAVRAPDSTMASAPPAQYNGCSHPVPWSWRCGLGWVAFCDLIPKIPNGISLQCDISTIGFLAIGFLGFGPVAPRLEISRYNRSCGSTSPAARRSWHYPLVVTNKAMV